MINIDAFNDAKKYIPGGVNSPVRSFKSIGGNPFFTKRASDCYLFDLENKRYIDYICSWGANIVGHANPYVVDKVAEAVKNGFSYGTPTELESELAKKVIKLMPSIEKLRLVSSGTEAAMSAIRLARGYTKKKYIIKFDGCYHGHSDALLVKAGSGVATFDANDDISAPSSSGVTNESVRHTLVLPYNDHAAVDATFDKYGDDIAAVIIEPIAGNMNFVRAKPEFLIRLRNWSDKAKSVLIFDEVMTGFRVALGGAQELFGVKPDLTILGKIVGGGMPLAAFGGKAEIMDHLSPLGDVYQAGTLSGNPIAVTCGLATLDLIIKDGFYQNLAKLSQQLIAGLIAIAANNGIELCGDYAGGMFGFYFSKHLPENFAEVQLAKNDLFKRFFHEMLNRGVYFAPSMYESGFICSSHSESVIEETLSHAHYALPI